ncbi:hypothetical protein D6D05_10408 [Aureobasidium pullulans]|nr:hypothetical protein D6D05_10408 [Aureobasidium pullulans]
MPITAPTLTMNFPLLKIMLMTPLTPRRCYTMATRTCSLPKNRERLEWHLMLANVLTGDVVKQEKKRLIVEDGRSRIKASLEEIIAFEIKGEAEAGYIVQKIKRIEELYPTRAAFVKANPRAASNAYRNSCNADKEKERREGKPNGLFYVVNTVIDKAKATLISNAEAFADRHLPPYIEELLILINFPSRLV